MKEDKSAALPGSLNLPISERRLLLGLGDIIAVNLSIVAALRLWAWVGERPFGIAFLLSQSYWFVLLSGLWLLLAATNDFFDLTLTARWLRSQSRLLQIQVQLLVAYLVIFFLSPREALPRLFILYYAGISYILIALWRLSRPFLIGWRPFRRRALVVGTGWAAQTITDAMQVSAADDYEIVGYVDEGKVVEPESVVVDAAVIGYGADLARIATGMNVSEIILATSSNIEGALFQALMDCYELGIPITPMPLLYEQLTGMVPVEYVGGHWNVVLPLEGQSPFNPYPMLKRLMDIGLSITGLLVFALLFLPLAGLMLVDSPGPIFYRQERMGRAGRVFQIVKLRSMVPDAERLKGPIWAVEADPRITRVGRLLRKSRLDEVPQLFNVLKGEMSMVGPRPERPFFVEHLQQTIPFYRTRLSVRPGLTGWAQINYRYGSTEEDALEKLKYDLYYIRHRSLLLDMLILTRTIGKVIRMEGV